MLLPVRCVSVGALVLNYGVATVALTQQDQLLLTLKERPHFQ
jgi:hypothetical protein